MKKIICHEVLFLILILCCSCGVSNIHTQNNEVTLTSQSDTNMMISDLPIYAEENVVYFADNYKTLKMSAQNKSTVIDECLPSELITDVYVDSENIFYVKYDFNEAKIISVPKNNLYDKHYLYEVPHSSATKFGWDYLYVDKGKIYYFNASTYTLYKFENDKEEHLDNITGAVIFGDNVYYADTSRNLYVCNNNLTNSRKIWAAEELTQTEDKALEQWCSVNLTEIAEIQQMSIHNDRLFFTISNTAMTPTRPLFSVKIDGTDFNHYKDFVLKSYQWHNDNLCIFGIKAASTTSRDEVFEYTDDGEIVDFNLNKRHIFLHGDECYYWDDEQEYMHLKRLNLKTKNIEAL